MHDPDLAEIRHEQAELRRRLRELDARIERLTVARALAPDRPQPPSPEPLTAADDGAGVPPPLPAWALAPERPAETVPPPGPVAPPLPQAPPREPEVPRDTFEMRLGKVWLARAGILLFLTGLVLLGNYAYQNYIAQIGPLPKLIAFYLGSFGLLGTGLWLERGRENTRAFARVLVAGGLAAIYYFTYAAHYVDALRVIRHPLPAGVLLLAVAAGIIGMAEKRRSEPLALLAFVLAFYTSAINRIAPFTLFSNLVLAAGAVFLMVRHRWLVMPFAAMLGAYGSYAFWRVAQPWEVWGSAFVAGTWFRAGFLTLTWLLFTAGAWLTRGMGGPRRIAWVTLNNAAWFGLLAFTLSELGGGAFWGLCFAAAGAFGVLAALAAWSGESRRDMAETYLAGALLLLAAGVFDRFAGAPRALVLACVAVLVTYAAARVRWITLRVAGPLLAVLACVAVLPAAVKADGLWGGAAVAILALLISWLGKRAGDQAAPTRWADIGALVPALGAAMVAAACVLRHADEGWQGAIFGLLALVWTAGYPLHRVRELATAGQSFVAGALVAFLAGFDRGMTPWAGLLALGAVLATGGALKLLVARPAPVGAVWVSRIYRVLVAMLFIGWVAEFVADSGRFAVLAAAGLLVFLLRGQSTLRLANAAILAGAGALGAVATRFEGGSFSWQDGFGWAVFLLLHQAGRWQVATGRAPEYAGYLHRAFGVAGVLGLWWFFGDAIAGRWFLTTVVWSLYALAVLGAGFLLGERLYRWLGLGLLGVSFARVLFVDVWQLGAGYRYLSFLVLGAVVLLVSFLYNRFQEQIRKWL